MSWRVGALASSLVVLALPWGCRGGGSSSGDGDADSDADADVGGEPWTDGDVPPSEAAARALCARYVECAGLVTPAGLGPVLETYGPMGSCWDSGADIVGVCAAACREGLADLALVYPDEPACAECLSESHCLDGPEPFCVSGRCVECRTAEDCDEDAPTCDADEGRCVSGACANGSDTDAIESADLTGVALLCSPRCGLSPGNSACLAECARDEVGVSEPCSVCVGDFGDCVFAACFDACYEGLEAPGCVECLETSCVPAFEECSGLEDVLAL